MCQCSATHSIAFRAIAEIDFIADAAKEADSFSSAFCSDRRSPAATLRNTPILRNALGPAATAVQEFQGTSIVEDILLISEIQTNCCFDDEISEWLADHITYIWASLDGWPEIQKKYRPIVDNKICHNDILKNALNLKERTFVGIRSTIVQETVDKQVELIKYFHSLGFTHVVSEPVFLPVISGQTGCPGRITGIDLNVYAENFVKAWYVADSLGMSYLNSFMVNFDEDVEYACRACLPTPHLTTDGFVSACDLAFYGDTPLKDLIFGKYDPISKGIDYFGEAKGKLRLRKCANIDACKMCSVSNICGGGCLGRMYHETRDFFGVIPEYCQVTRYLADKLPLERIKITHLHP